MIFVFRSDGLCARLNHLWQVSYLSEKYKTHINCIWKPTSQCDINFYKIFVKQDFFSVYSSFEELAADVPQYADVKLPINFFGMYHNDEYISGGEVSSELNFDGRIKYFNKMFNFDKNIINKFNKIKNKYNINEMTYSFYVRGLESFGRRSNIKESSINNVIEGTIEKIRTIVSNNKDARILIASPESRIEKMVIDCFPKNCFIIKEDKKPTHMLGIDNTGRDEQNVIGGLILLLFFCETKYESIHQESFFYSFPFYLKRIKQEKKFWSEK